jgi:hypothetical protein
LRYIIAFDVLNRCRKSIDAFIAGVHGPAIDISNHINGINGDPSGNDNGEEVHSLTVPAITSLQETYVRKVVDTLNDLDNVLYEISGDAPSSSRQWQYYMINYLKNYEAIKPKQHPVGMSYLYLGSANDLLASPADWILLPGTDTNPPLVVRAKIIFSDMDTMLLGSGSYPMVWKRFLTGRTIAGGTARARSPVLLASPINGDAVLYLHSRVRALPPPQVYNQIPLQLQRSKQQRH